MLVSKKCTVVGMITIPQQDYAKVVIVDDKGTNEVVHMSLTKCKEEDISIGDVVEVEYNNQCTDGALFIKRIILDSRHI